MLVMKAVSAESLHGLGIARWIESATGDRLTVEEGALYPSLHRRVSLGLMRLLETLLFDISSVDPVTYLLVPSTLALVAATSAWLPAKRAVRVDPRSALVSE